MELTSERIVAEIGAASFQLPSDDSESVPVQVEIPKHLLKGIDERFGKGRICRPEVVALRTFSELLVAAHPSS